MAIITRIEHDDPQAAVLTIERLRRETLRTPGVSIKSRHCIGFTEVVMTVAEAGDPATYSIGSDSYAYEVTRVLGKTRLMAKRQGSFEDEGHMFTLRMNGVWRPQGSPCGSLAVGYAIDHLDPSF